MATNASSAAPTVRARFIDPETLARIGRLELVAKTVVSGFFSGLHRAKSRAVSTNFAEHKPYLPGDDLRHLDWRVYARRDRLYIKQYEAETNAPLILLLDQSRSMAYRSGGISKFDYARFAAASLAWLGHRQRDRVGLLAFSGTSYHYSPASARLGGLFHLLESLVPEGDDANFDALLQAAAGQRQRGVAVLLSDCYLAPEQLAGILDTWRLRGFDVIVLHILDEGELELPYEGELAFEDLETQQQLITQPDRIRTAYRQAIEGHRQALAQLLGRRRIDYLPLTTRQPLDHALRHLLHQRRRS